MMLSTILLVEAGERVAGKSAEEFGKMDPTGVAMAVIAMSIVFSALILLFITFKYVARLYTIDLKKRFHKSRPHSEITDEHEEISGETLAAISLALHLYHQQMQGLEDAVITFKNAAKTYSPWSSKIYGLRKTPNN
jgi:Na+-transporting methylmalonyl-CoA/oxaloacetate decarboxylase gamma subunit